mmetsp:Transcript_10444/g.26104  ORF Transcript_10444/g.26104 Transcript_10444/m.26104 type:complete len:209 (-) Transcript_10444:692-1318(-)
MRPAWATRGCTLGGMSATHDMLWPWAAGISNPEGKGHRALVRLPANCWTLPVGRSPVMPMPRLCSGCANLHWSWYLHHPLFFQWQQTIPLPPTPLEMELFALAPLLCRATWEAPISPSAGRARAPCVEWRAPPTPEVLGTGMGTPPSAASVMHAPRPAMPADPIIKWSPVAAASNCQFTGLGASQLPALVLHTEDDESDSKRFLRRTL